MGRVAKEHMVYEEAQRESNGLIAGACGRRVKNTISLENWHLIPQENRCQKCDIIFYHGKKEPTIIPSKKHLIGMDLSDKHTSLCGRYLEDPGLKTWYGTPKEDQCASCNRIVNMHGGLHALHIIRKRTTTQD